MNTKFIGVIQNNNWLFVLVGILLTLLNYLPYLIAGTDSNVLIHDNLDSNIVWYKTVLESVGWLSAPNAIVPNTLQGLPRSSLSSFYDLAFISFDLFGMYYGYVMNKMLMSMTAFCGMFLLLRNWVIPTKTQWAIHYTISILFAILPFWSFSLHIAAIPLVFHAFCSILYNRPHWYSWLIIVGYAFGSSIVLAGLFVISMLVFLWVYHYFTTKELRPKFLAGISLLLLSYCVSHLPLLSSFFLSGGEISHRTAFNLQLLNFDEAVYQSNWLFRKGQYHTHSMHFLFIPLIILAKGLQISAGKKHVLFDVLLLSAGLFAVVYGFISWESAAPYISIITNLIPIQLQRFHIFYPVIWFLLLAITFHTFTQQMKYGLAIVIVVFVIQFDNLWNEREINNNTNTPSFKAYYSESEYSKMKTHIKQPTDAYKVMSVAIDPAVALFNGLHTIDGYFTDYPLEYKTEFRKIISKELEKNESVSKYFDNWGSRCYAFSTEFGINMLHGKTDTIKNLQLNTQKALRLNCQYLLAGVFINNSEASNLKFEKLFTSPENHWNIYLYKINPPNISKTKLSAKQADFN